MTDVYNRHLCDALLPTYETSRVLLPLVGCPDASAAMCTHTLYAHGSVSDQCWQEAQADKATFRLTDNVAEKAAARAAEEARVQEVLKGAFDAKAIGGSGSVFDEF